MQYIESFSTDPAWNLALEEFVFSHMDRSKTYFILWQNHNTVVIGKNQNTIAEINSAFVQEHDIHVVRRLSGGGAVYHDLGNLNFSFIADASAMNEINFTRFCQPVVDTLQSLGVPAEVNGRNDMIIQGRKFSGNAQYTKAGRVLHHGTLMFASDLSVVAGALSPDRAKLQTKGIASVSSRVCNISEYLPKDVTLEDFKRILITNIMGAKDCTPYEFSAEELAKIQQLKEQRYDLWDWNYGFSPRYQIVKQKRFEGCGTIQVSLDVDKGTIQAIQFLGDFFDYGNLDEFSSLLQGHKIQKEDLQQYLLGIDPGTYIKGLSAQALAELISE